MASGAHPNYRRIYLILLAALVVSVAGPFLEILVVTLLTAFGVAIYKARLVVANFMHLRWEKKLMRVMLTTSLLLMALFVAGVAPDVMNHRGNNWVNTAAIDAVDRGLDGAYGDDADYEDEEGGGVAEVVFNAQATFNIACATCHGETGDGTGPGGAALDPKPASFTEAVFWETRDEERIFNVIKNGAASVGGSPLMVAWGAAYNDEQIQALADYVLAFRPVND